MDIQGEWVQVAHVKVGLQLTVFEGLGYRRRGTKLLCIKSGIVGRGRDPRDRSAAGEPPGSTNLLGLGEHSRVGIPTFLAVAKRYRMEGRGGTLLKKCRGPTLETWGREQNGEWSLA